MMNNSIAKRKLNLYISINHLLVALAVCPALAGSRPNVVFILADDLGHRDLSGAGSELHQTPHIDALARSSLAFEFAYTSPTCSPSRSAILSGKNPARLGIVGHGGIRSMSGGGEFLVSEEYTLAEALRDAGYATCHIGKWHVGVSEGAKPGAQGFDKVVASNDFCCPGSYFYPFRDKQKSGPAAQRSAVRDLDHYGPEDHLTMCLGKEAAAYLASREGAEQPFFLNLWYYAVHTPIQAMSEKVEKYREAAKKCEHQRNPSYAALVEHLDDSVGLVLEALEEHGLADNTIVIFFSDNGGEIRRGVTSNFPLRAGKTTLYEGGVRVPLFVRWPGVTRAGQKCREPVVGHDFYPTILSMVGAEGSEEQNAAMDGVDISSVLRDPQSSLPARPLCWLRYGEMVHYPTYKNDPVFGPSAAIRKGEWKMVERYPTPHGLERKFELFNLQEDPYEQVNLASQRPDVLTELQQELKQWQVEVDVPTYEELAYPAFEKAN